MDDATLAAAPLLTNKEVFSERPLLPHSAPQRSPLQYPQDTACVFPLNVKLLLYKQRIGTMVTICET